MSNFTKKIFSISFYPFLIAIFPILSFYSENISEVFLDAIVNPILVVTLITILFFTTLSIMFNNRQKAGILTSLFLILFFSYGHLLSLVGDFHVNLGIFSIGENKALYTIYSLLLISVIYILIKYKGSLQNITKLLSIFSIILVSFSIVNIVSYEVREGRLSTSLINRNSVSGQPLIKLKTSNKTPDIYYLIFDRYAANSTLREFYNFDNEKFTNYLTKKGFYVASESKTNYGNTPQSLASSLNMQYINYLSKEVGENSGDKTVLYKLYDDYKVQRFLKSIGYRYVHVGSWWEPTRKNKHANENFLPRDEEYLLSWINLDEFSKKLIGTTVLPPILSKLLPNSALSNPLEGSRNLALFQFNSLEEIPNIRGSKFVFAHIIVPHEPYIFDQNCNPIAKKIDPQSEDAIGPYLNQLTCVNKKIKHLVNQILSKSKTPPIIVLQSDEGPHPKTKKLPVSTSFSFVPLKEKFRILNAIYLPNLDKNILYPSITPVNTFRLIFNNYFGTNYELLPDKSYKYQDPKHYYKFIDVTKEVSSD